MKKIILISISLMLLAIVSCKKKGVCTCTKDGATTKTYYEELTFSEKQFAKRSCNGDSDGIVTKTEYSSGGVTVSDEDDSDLNQKNCEWSRKGE